MKDWTKGFHEKGTLLGPRPLARALGDDASCHSGWPLGQEGKRKMNGDNQEDQRRYCVYNIIYIYIAKR